MPDLVRLYLQSVLVGFALAAVFTVGLVWSDLGGIGHLILESEIGLLAAAMMVVFNGIVFSAVQFAFRVMALAETDEDPRGGHGAGERVLVPVEVRAKVRQRR